MERKRRDKIIYQLFTLPAVLLFTVFVMAPLALCIIYSFTDYTVGKKMTFVGLKNYFEVFKDDIVVGSISYTIQFAVISTISITVLALILAILFTKESHTGKLQRAMFYFPSCISLMVAGYAWRNLMTSDADGLVNRVLAIFHCGPIQWLSDPFWAKVAIMIVAIWIDLGWCAMLFYAYIQSVDESLYEVAKLDGANAFQKAWYITIPMIRPSIIVNLTLLLSQGLKVYEIPQALTKGGPMTSTYTVTHAILVRGVTEWDFGIASATGVFVFILTTVLCILQLKLTEKKEG